MVFISAIIIRLSDKSKLFFVPAASFFAHISHPLASDLRYNPAMPMTPFFQRFPELGARETRSVTVNGRNDLPDGDYGFIELYCNELHCDCRRVMVVVLRPDTGWNQFWATINYGWESLEFYRKWAGAPGWDRGSWQGPFLDPLATQTRYASALLDLFKFLLQSPDYVERLKNHYQLFRASVEKDLPSSEGRPRPPVVAKNPPRRNRKRSPQGVK
jgi:hypothetical protein